jgi:hypothetical protein
MYNIVKINEIAILFNIARLNEIYSIWTTYVTLFLRYANGVMPVLFKDERFHKVHLENKLFFNPMTRSRALELPRERANSDPEFIAERSEDIIDIAKLGARQSKRLYTPVGVT